MNDKTEPEAFTFGLGLPAPGSENKPERVVLPELEPKLTIEPEFTSDGPSEPYVHPSPETLRDRGLAILKRVPGAAKTKEELKDCFVDAISYSMAMHNRPMGLTDLSRRYSKVAKQYGGVRSLATELTEELRVIPLETHKKSTIFLTPTDYEFAKEMAHESCSDAHRNLFKMYHDRDSKQY